MEKLIFSSLLMKSNSSYNELSVTGEAYLLYFYFLKFSLLFHVYLFLFYFYQLLFNKLLLLLWMLFLHL